MTKTKVEPRLNMTQRAMLLEQLEEIREQVSVEVCYADRKYHGSELKRERHRRALKAAVRAAGITRDVSTLERVTKKLRDQGFDCTYYLRPGDIPGYDACLEAITPAPVDYEAIFRLLKAELTVCETCSRGASIITEANHHLSNSKEDKS